ncbi:MAG: hypothetical protein CVU06_13710, partial [Bacteroidetes bacterium HGW-Bacteroidetes-22]
MLFCFTKRLTPDKIILPLIYQSLLTSTPAIFQVRTKAGHFNYTLILTMSYPKINRIACLLFALACISASFPQPAEPFLRLNSPMHTSLISGINMNAAGTLILTSSFDKTAMLWDAVTGERLRVFRPPIGEGAHGRICSAAISPDGKLAALTGYENSIYFFSCATGEMTDYLSEPITDVFDLEFSHDGNYLAAAMASGEGILIYRKSAAKAAEAKYEMFRKLS